MVSINNVTVAFGSYTLLDAISFHKSASWARTEPANPL